MRAPRTRLLTSLVAGVSAALLLAGCSSHASVSPTPVASYAGEPKGVQASAASAGGAPWAVWMKPDSSEFAVTLYGSAQCPPYATGYKVTAPDEITMQVKPEPSGCPQGYSPFTTVFERPRNLDPDVTIQFTAQDTHFYLAPEKSKKK